MSGGNALHDLIRNGSIREALDLINSGSWLEEKDDQERTSLILAVREGYVDIVKALIHKGADLNHKDKYGRTALHYAALSGSEEISKMLLKAGADSLIRDKRRKTAAQYTKKNTSLRSFFKKTEKKRINLLNIQAKNLENHRKKVLKENADLNMDLAKAIGSRDIESILKFINMGADINTHALNGHTALHVALEKGKVAVAQHLVDRGASVIATDGAGNTPLMLAQKKGIVIVAYEANVSVSDKKIQPKLADIATIIKAANVTIIEPTKVEVKKPIPKQIVSAPAKDKPIVVRQSQASSGGNTNNITALPKATRAMSPALQAATRILSASSATEVSLAVPLIPSATPSSKTNSPAIIKK
jgi:ankyrin repeat protein